MDPISGCVKWACVPKQPRCCVQTYPKKCKKNFYSGEVHDPKTGCLIWTCIACPVDDGIDCAGVRIPHIRSNGCTIWTCIEYTVDV